MCNFKYMDSDSAMDDLSRNSKVGEGWFKKSRFQYFRDVDFVCEHACRMDYMNLKHCSKEMKDNAKVVLSSMFMCHNKYEQELALLNASKRLQERVKEVISFKQINIEQALSVIAHVEAKIKRFNEMTKEEA